MKRKERVEGLKTPRVSEIPARKPIRRHPATLMTSVSTGKVAPALSRATSPPVPYRSSVPIIPPSPTRTSRSIRAPRGSREPPCDGHHTPRFLESRLHRGLPGVLSRAMTTARALQPQDRIAHYRIIGPLGAGGMGEVYLAEDQTLERSVALKVLPPELVRSEERVRRFVREAKSASSLNHPNIITIYEIGQDEIRHAEGTSEPGSASVHFISMELVS